MEEGAPFDTFVFRQVVDNLPQCIFWKDRSGKFLGCNAAGALAIGFSHVEEISGKSDYDLHKNFLVADYLRIEDEGVMAGGMPIYRHISKGSGQPGQEHWYETSKVPLRSVTGKVVGLLISYEDISELKRAEEQLQHVNRTLEQRVSEETRKNLEQDRILTHQARHAAMGEMISNIAHQWRQPLTVLGLVLQNIHYDFKDGRLNQETLEEYVTKSLRAIGQMSTTIDDFRDFFKPSRQARQFCIFNAIEDALAMVNASLRNSNIESGVTGDRGIEMFGYPGELSQVMLNLITNAKDAIQEGKIPAGRIDIAVAAADLAVIVTVCDNAGGIAPESLDRIFDPYFSTKENGTGIGLYMTKVIVEQHFHGTITADNSGEGARFCLTIPSLGMGA